MNQSNSNNTMMDTSDMVQPTKIDQSSDSMKSFFKKLAQDKCVIGFSLVSDNALPPRYDRKRNSAPPVINGATRKLISFDEAPSCPTRRSSARDFSDQSPGLFLETIFDEVLDTVLGEADRTLYEVDECDEDKSINSQDSQPSASARPLHEEDPNFDFSFQRFSVDPSAGESPDSSTRSSASMREQMVAPKLPVRRESMERLGSIESGNSRLSSGSISVTGVMAGNLLDDAPPSASLSQSPLVPPELWQHPQGRVGLQCPASAPTTRGVLDMNGMSDIFEPSVLLSPESSKYGRRRRRKRRSSLDTGLTFRNSFSSGSEHTC